MLNILICCGGGFSSSAMATKVEKEIHEKGLQDEVHVEFYPFSIAYQVMDRFDLIMACPHLKFSVKEFLQKHPDAIPIYLLPPKMYGTMNIEDVIEDAKGVLEGYKQNPMNPFHFPGEDNVMRIRRSTSYAKNS